jgi:hypothetical protein
LLNFVKENKMIWNQSYFVWGWILKLRVWVFTSETCISGIKTLFKYRVKALEFYAGAGSGQPPVDLTRFPIAYQVPRRSFFPHPLYGAVNKLSFQFG